MSKGSIQKMTNDLITESKDLIDKINGSKKIAVSQLTWLQNIENEIKDRMKREKEVRSEEESAKPAHKQAAQPSAAEKAVNKGATEALEETVKAERATSLQQAPEEKVDHAPEFIEKAPEKPVSTDLKDVSKTDAANPSLQKQQTEAGGSKQKKQQQQQVVGRAPIGIRVVKPRPDDYGKPVPPKPRNESQSRQDSSGRQYGQPRSEQQNRQYGQPRSEQQNRQYGQNRPDSQNRQDRPPRSNQKQSGFNSKDISKTITPAVTKPQNATYARRKDKRKDDKPADEKAGYRSPKQLKRELDGTAVVGDALGVYVPTGSRKRPNKRPGRPYGVMEKKKIEHAVITGETVVVKDLAEKIGVPGSDIIKKLLILGIMVNINQAIDFDSANLVANEFGVSLEQKLEKTNEEKMIDIHDDVDNDGELSLRPPIVTVMGHVDHGKTSLLDAIRKSNVLDTEAGGITQHIGAYTIEHKDQKITFIDTPGHEAFTAMRARGAQVTDIAILVVAADDGVMPQTVEAINHSKAAGVPIIVAINKVDKPAANPDRVKQELTEYELVAEEWGGDTIMVPVSAITRQGIEDLLEMITIQSEMLELQANPKAQAKGTIIEARLESGRGPVATILVQNGTLNIGDPIVAGTVSGKVRAMMNDKGESIKEAGPSIPVEVIGFSDVPGAGDIMYSVDEKLVKRVAQERRDKQREERMHASSAITLDDLFGRVNAGFKELNIIIKGDVQGSVEALRQSVEKLSNDDVHVKVIHDAVGAITESDVLLASTSGSIIIGFNVRPDNNARAMAEKEAVEIRTYRIIYNVIEDITLAMKGMLEPVFEETVEGHAQVRNVIKITNVGNIAGSYVTDGSIKRRSKVRVIRDGVIIYEGSLSSLKRFKDDVSEVAQGYECGIGVENFNDVKEGDVIESYVMKEVEPK